MKLAVLFSGGKDSTYALYLAKKHGHSIDCLISITSKNPDSYMFHTPSISKTQKQAKMMGIPLIVKETKGEKEMELEDLEIAIKQAKEKYSIKGIITGAVESVYQATRIQKICNKFGLECFNPIWQKNQIELLKDLVNEGFKIIITGVFAYPLDSTWLLRKIDNSFILETTKLQKKYGLSPAGEGGEFETFVLNCPLFKEELKIKNKKISGEGHSWKVDIEC